MPRPPKEPSALRSINAGAKRSANLERRYIASSGGAGLQFNSGTYGADNLGDYLVVEANDAITSDFTQTNSGSGDVVGYGMGFNAANGVYMTNDAAQGQFVLTLESFATGTHPSTGLLIAVRGVTGASEGIDVTYGNSTATNHGQTGIAVAGASITNAGHTTTAGVFSDANDGAGDSLGVQGEGTNGGTGKATGGSFEGISGVGAGDAVGVLLNAVSSSANAYAIKVVAGLCYLSLPTSPGLSGTLYNNGGIVTVSP